MSITAMKQNRLRTPALSKLILVAHPNSLCAPAKQELRAIKKQYRFLVEQMTRTERALDSMTRMVEERNDAIRKLKSKGIL